MGGAFLGLLLMGLDRFNDFSGREVLATVGAAVLALILSAMASGIWLREIWSFRVALAGAVTVFFVVAESIKKQVP